MSQRHFTPALFGFLRDLARNNDRDWFNAHKQRYEDSVREPALQFIRDFEPQLEAISPHFLADDRKSGGSLFRIHRDVRFSKDKSPYKTNTGIHFRHEQGRNAHCPGYYLHLDPKGVFAGAGIWHPDSGTLARIRSAIAADPEGWRRAAFGRAFRARYELSGNSLKRPPKGYDPEYPLIEDLKRKDFIAVTSLSQKAVTSAGFLREYARLCRQARPLMGFLCAAIGVEF